MKKELLKQGFVDFLYIQLVIFAVSMFISGPIDIFSGFIFGARNMVGRRILRTVLTTLVELGIIALLFYKKKYNDRNISKRDFLMPLTIALSIHFLISLINGFYHYTAGAFVSELGYMWGYSIVGGVHYDKSTLPLWPNLVLTPFHIAMIIGAVLLGYALADKKQKKEREDILGLNESDNVS